MKPSQYHRPGTPLMPEIAPPVYRTWLELDAARARAVAALHIGLVLGVAGTLGILAAMVAWLSH